MTRSSTSAVLALARDVARTGRWRLVSALILTIGVAALSAAGGLALVPLAASIGLDTGAAGRQITVVVAHALALVGQPLTVGWALAGFVGATAAQTVLGRLARLAEDDVYLQVMRQWRTRMFDRLLRVDWAHYSRYRTSDLHELLVEQVDRSGVGARNLLRLASSAAVSAAYLIVAVRLSLFVTLLALGGALVLVAVLAGWRRRTRALGALQGNAARSMFAVVGESLSAMKTIRAHGAEAVQSTRLRSAMDQMHEVHRDLVLADSGARQLFDIGSVVMLGLVAYVALVVRGIPPAELFVLLFVFARVGPQVSALHSQYQQVLAELPAYLRLHEADALAAAHDDGGHAGGVEAAFEQELLVEGVTFGYADEPVLHGVTLRVRRGETVAVVGPSGGGKSTLADVILGLLRPQAGALVVDGTTLQAAQMPAWRGQLGYVAQDGVLFNDTVRENLLWGAPAASEHDVRSALEASAAWSFVSALPQGLETPIGDRGVLLSGGERQRLALARALLRRPRLLVLDEATSALDSENERLIASAIEELHGRNSILLITHRLATVRRADVIYVLDAGRIVESGTWHELLARRGRFHALCMAQGIDANGGSAVFPRVVSGA